MKRISALISLVVLGLLTACGGGGGGGGPKQDITVSVGPKTASVAGGQTQTIRATILNPNNTGVTWTLAGTGCTGTACGTLSNPGGNNNQGWTIDYTAPLAIPSPATVTITATSKDDPTKSDSSSITITAAVVTVSVSPVAPTVPLGATQQFTATVKGTTNTAVTWSVTGPGTLSTSGLYTAPATLATPASVTVTATSQADNTKSGTATINIPAVTVSVSPKTPTVILGATLQFSATVGNASNPAVTWSVSGPGTVSVSGLYTAPNSLSTPATVTITATSAADSTKSGSTTINIPAVTLGLSPGSPTVILGATQQFTAAVGNATNTAVTWSMTGVGTISATGLYTAPASLSTPSTATVIVTSVADPSKSASTTVTIPAVGVTVAPPTISLQGGASQTFTATVSNATNKSVTWSMSGLGTLGTNGAYTAPTVVPSQQTATITATSAADPGKSGSAVVTLIPVSVSVTPSPVTVAINSTQQFAAAVTGTSNAAVTWSVSGAGCTGSACGTISAAGLYTAPSAIPNPAAVTVRATSAADSTKFGTATLTITDNANSKLTGSFAFVFQGFYGSSMMAMIGSFTADGNGNLTNGRRDENSTSGAPPASTTFSGTYQLHGDNRGIMTFTTLPGSPSFRFAINDNADKGTFVEIDSTGVSGGGRFRKQTTADFLASRITGDYAFGFYGNSVTGERNAAVGRMHADGVGSISAGEMDTSDSVRTQFTGSFVFSGATGSANGRGTMSIVVPGTEGGTFPASFYAVNTNQIFFLLSHQVGLDSPLLLGEIRRQTGAPFSVAALNGNSVFHWVGFSASTPGTTWALIGQFKGNSATSSLTGSFAETEDGLEDQNVLTGTYSISTNGRSLFDSPQLGRAIFYLTGPNSGFVLSGDALGEMEAQTLPVGGLSDSDLAGRYLVSGTQIPVSNSGAFTGYVNLDGTGDWTSTVDLSSPIYGATDLYNAGEISVIDGNTGLISMTVTVPSPYYHLMYAVTPGKLLDIDVDQAYANQGVLWQAPGFWEK